MFYPTWRNSLSRRRGKPGPPPCPLPHCMQSSSPHSGRPRGPHIPSAMGKPPPGKTTFLVTASPFQASIGKPGLNLEFLGLSELCTQTWQSMQGLLALAPQGWGAHPDGITPLCEDRPREDVNMGNGSGFWAFGVDHSRVLAL